jgi:hypothetical protein
MRSPLQPGKGMSWNVQRCRTPAWIHTGPHRCHAGSTRLLKYTEDIYICRNTIHWFHAYESWPHFGRHPEIENMKNSSAYVEVSIHQNGMKKSVSYNLHVLLFQSLNKAVITNYTCSMHKEKSYETKTFIAKTSDNKKSSDINMNNTP